MDPVRRVGRMKRHVRGQFRAVAMVAVVGIALAACTRPEDQGGTPIPGMQSGAPLYDEAVGPSDQETKIDE